jgi:hypothetical protein
MQTNLSPQRKDFLAGWRKLVEEINDIEELIADSRAPHDTQAQWSLHLLQSQLNLKRQMLKDYLDRDAS